MLFKFIRVEKLALLDELSACFASRLYVPDSNDRNGNLKANHAMLTCFNA